MGSQGLDAMLLLAAALSLVIGAVLGMLGGGGAILTLPMLVYVLRVESRAAIATSLVVVGVTSALGTVVHAKAVRWRVGGVFGAAAMVGAYGGGRLARYVPAGALLAAFAVVMLVTAIAMLRGRGADDGTRRPLAIGKALALGALVGVVSGLVGAGGGFLIVPVLTLFGGLAMREAVGTSLFVITLQSAAGFAGQMGSVSLDVPLVATVAGASALGALGGAWASGRVPAASLRRAFAWLVLVMGLFVVAKQLPLTVFLPVALVTAVVAVLVTVAGRTHGRGTAATSGPPVKEPQHAGGRGR